MSIFISRNLTSRAKSTSSNTKLNTAGPTDYIGIYHVICIYTSIAYQDEAIYSMSIHNFEWQNFLNDLDIRIYRVPEGDKVTSASTTQSTSPGSHYDISNSLLQVIQ